MFEKLFMLVKNNAMASILNNPVIPAGSCEAVINEASSSIIEVLKGQLETGKVNDLIKFFKFSDIHSATLITRATNKFANKLNKFYNIDMASAHTAASSLIPDVMKQLVQQSKSNQVTEFSLNNVLSDLNGKRGDISGLVTQLQVA